MAEEASAPRGRSSVPFLLASLGLALLLLLLIVAPKYAELARQVECQQKLKAIATCLKVYSAACPEGTPFINWAVSQGHLAAEETICPSSGDSASNYVIVPFPSRPARNDDVLVFEPKSNHGGDGGNFVFADGHATFARSGRYDELETGVRSRTAGR